MFEHVRPNRGPRTLGAHTCVPKIFTTLQLPISINKKTVQNKLVGKYALYCITKIDIEIVSQKIEQNTVIWPFISILWVGPIIFFRPGPHIC